MTTPFEKILNSKSGLFHTPDSWDDLMDWIERHPPKDRPALITAAGMAWNLALEASAQSLKTDSSTSNVLVMGRPMADCYNSVTKES